VTLHDHLAHTLGGAHDIGGVDGLVGGNHHKAVNLVLFTELNRVEGTQHIVFYRFDAVMLHQGNVLVGSGVKNYIGTVFLKNLFQSDPVADRKNLDLQIQCFTVTETKLLLNVVGTVFVYIQNDQETGIHRGNLPTELASDRTAAAGYQDGFVMVVGFDATDDAVAAVKAGRMAATIAQQPALIGEKAVVNAVELMSGKSIPGSVPVEVTLITKENAK